MGIAPTMCEKPSIVLQSIQATILVVLHKLVPPTTGNASLLQGVDLVVASICEKPSIVLQTIQAQILVALHKKVTPTTTNASLLQGQEVGIVKIKGLYLYYIRVEDPKSGARLANDQEGYRKADKNCVLCSTFNNYPSVCMRWTPCT